MIATGNTREQRETRRRLVRSETAAALLTRVGMPVRFWKHDGSQMAAQTASLPWLGEKSGLWVVKLEGVAGGVACHRVTPLESGAAK